jgi:elongation factor P
MVIMNASDIQRNTKLDYEGDLWVVVDYNFHSKERGRGLVRTRLKNMLNGRVLDVSFRSNDKVERAEVNIQKMQYLYLEDAGFVFMDNETFEQITVPQDVVGDSSQFLMENMEVDVLFHHGNAVQIEPPNFVALKVVNTEPGIKGDTVSGATKAATLETGLEIQVPLFIEQDEVLKIDTRTKKYAERA